MIRITTLPTRSVTGKLLNNMAVLRIRIQIRQIHMFLGFPDPDPLVRDTDPDLDPALDPPIIMQK